MSSLSDSLNNTPLRTSTISIFKISSSDSSEAFRIASCILFKSKLTIAPSLFLICVINLSRSEEHTSELQSRFDLVCRLLLEKKNTRTQRQTSTCRRDEQRGRV